jgi:hypothetical protein
MQDSNEKTESQPGNLIHPSREEWISYLYGELPRANRVALSAHRERCPHCEAQLAQWRAAMKNLNAWKLPIRSVFSPGKPLGIFQPALKWAAAAAIILGIGFGVGRISSLASGDVETVRASLQREFDRKIETARVELAGHFQREQTDALNQVVAASASGKAEMERLLTELARSVEEARAADSESMAVALQRLDNKWTALHADLRKELETVAVLTEDGFNDTQHKLYQLANFTQTPVNK